MQHKEHLVSEQKVVQPLSPRVHFLRVPCHLRFSLPGVRFMLAKLPRASTESLRLDTVRVVFRVEGGGDNVPVCVVLVRVLLRRYDLVDGADFRTRGGVSP